MKIEKVRIMQTLKCGNASYAKGTILSGDDITSDIIAEIRAGSPAVGVLLPEPVNPEPSGLKTPSAKHPGRLEAENEILKEKVSSLIAQVEALQEKLDVFTKTDEILGPPSHKSEEDGKADGGFPCKEPGCGYVGETFAQLRGHMSKHKKTSK